MSGSYAISADGVSKRYRMWSGEAQHNQLRTMLVQRAKAVLSGQGGRREVGEFWALRDASFRKIGRAHV